MVFTLVNNRETGVIYFYTFAIGDFFNINRKAEKLKKSTYPFNLKK